MEGSDPRSTPPGPPPWPQHYPPTQPTRQWLPVAIIVAAIIIATSVISAVLLTRDTNTAAPATPAPTPIGGAQGSSTCAAWPSSKAALDAIPGLPAGWDWDTPMIDVYISNQSAAVNKALDLFEPEIAATDPPQVVAAAKEYVSARRLGMQKLVGHTFTSADAVPINVALAKLNQACPAPTTAGGTPTQAGAAAASSTCEAWPSTKAALNAIPALPAGWNWDTPNIDVYIANQSAAVNKALDLFEPQIAASDPPQVAEAAKTYVSERRLAVQKHVDHTYTQADGVSGNVALAKLDQACGTS
jgi:hypothetical protein